MNGTLLCHAKPSCYRCWGRGLRSYYNAKKPCECALNQIHKRLTPLDLANLVKSSSLDEFTLGVYTRWLKLNRCKPVELAKDMNLPYDKVYYSLTKAKPIIALLALDQGVYPPVSRVVDQGFFGRPTGLIKRAT